MSVFAWKLLRPGGIAVSTPKSFSYDELYLSGGGNSEKSNKYTYVYKASINAVIKVKHSNVIEVKGWEMWEDSYYSLSGQEESFWRSDVLAEVSIAKEANKAKIWGKGIAVRPTAK